MVEIGNWLVSVVFFMKDNFQGVFDAIRIAIASMVSLFYDILTTEPILFIIIVTLIALLVANNKVTLFTAAGLTLILAMELWQETMQTLALILAATILAVVSGIPLGILKAQSGKANTVMEPILDFMQTLNPLVYLIPSVLLFRIGDVPGVVATFIFAMPPAIRLTSHGIEQVSEQMIEVGRSFGADSRQLLFKIKLPLALPSIMVGVNQTIMLSFSMVVIAGFIGAAGLGQEIISGIMRYNLAPAIEAGLAVVILAIILDRITRMNTAGRGNNLRLLLKWIRKTAKAARQ